MTKSASWDPVWESIFQAQEWGQYPPEDLIRFIAKNFYSAKDRASVKILEVGCGPGANVWFIAREGFSAYGVEGSQTAVQKCLARLNKEVPGWRGEVRVGDIQNLDYPDEFFDGVFDVEAIYANSLEASIKIMSEIRRVLKPGGKFFSKTFATGSLGDGTGEKVGKNSYITNHGGTQAKSFSRYTESSDWPLLTQGFRIDELNLLQRSVGGAESNRSIKEWLASATKI